MIARLLKTHIRNKASTVRSLLSIDDNACLPVCTQYVYHTVRTVRTVYALGEGGLLQGAGVGELVAHLQQPLREQREDNIAHLQYTRAGRQAHKTRERKRERDSTE